MKNFRITTLLMATVALLSFSACSDDDGDDGNGSGTNPPASSSISFDGKTYNMKSGFTFEYGALSFDGNSPATHYNNDFIISDGSFTAETDTFGTNYLPSSNTSIVSYIELFSPDTLGFKSGTFNYISDDSVTVNSVRNKYFFSIGTIQLDNDGVTGDTLSGAVYNVTGGSVNVAGSNTSNYKLTYNLQFEGGRSFIGTYSSSFVYVDER